MKLQLIPRDILTVSLILFAVIDIVGSVPAILSIKKKVGTINAERASLWSFIIMMVFLFVGESILEFLGLDLKSFAIAGSIVLFLLAIEMLLGIKLYHDEMPATASVVPIAFPLIAGAGTMTTLLSLRSEYRIENVIAAIIINIILVYLCLRNLKYIEKMLGEGGLSILRKVFSFILLAIAIKLFRTNVGF